MYKLIPTSEVKQEIKFYLSPGDGYFDAHFDYPEGEKDIFFLRPKNANYRQIFPVPRRLVFRPDPDIPEAILRSHPELRMNFDEQPGDVFSPVSGLENFLINEVCGPLNASIYSLSSHPVRWYNYPGALFLIGTNSDGSQQNVGFNKVSSEHLRFSLHLGDQLFHQWGQWDRVFPDSRPHPRIMGSPWNWTKDQFDEEDSRVMKILEKYYPQLLPDTPSDNCYCLSRQTISM